MGVTGYGYGKYPKCPAAWGNQVRSEQVAFLTRSTLRERACMGNSPSLHTNLQRYPPKRISLMYVAAPCTQASNCLEAGGDPSARRLRLPSM